MLKGGAISASQWAGPGALGRSKERDLMQDATTLKSEREMILILMSSSAGGVLMAWGESGRQAGEISVIGA